MEEAITAVIDQIILVLHIGDRLCRARLPSEDLLNSQLLLLIVVVRAERLESALTKVGSSLRIRVPKFWLDAAHLSRLLHGQEALTPGAPEQLVVSPPLVLDQ